LPPYRCHDATAFCPYRLHMDYIERLTETKINKLVHQVSQDREAWRELVTACFDLQPADLEQEREREREIVDIWPGGQFNTDPRRL